MIDEKRMYIIKIASDIVQEKGLSKLNMREVAKRSGLSVGSIYNICGDKEELIKEIIQNYWDDVYHEINELKEEVNRENFIETMNNVYLIISKKSNEFHKNWIKDIESLNLVNKEINYIMEEYKLIFADAIEKLMLEDPYIKDQFDDEFTSKKMAEIMLELMIAYLREDKKDIKFLNVCFYRIFNL